MSAVSCRAGGGGGGGGAMDESVDRSVLATDVDADGMGERDEVLGMAEAGLGLLRGDGGR